MDAESIQMDRDSRRGDQTDLEPNACLAFYQASKVELFTKIVIVNIGTILVQQPSGTIINSIPLDEF